MSHMRKQIRDALQTAVTGLATTGSNVFPGRVHNLPATKLPALLIYGGPAAEQIEYGSLGADRLMLRNYEITIEVRADGTDPETVEDLLDQVILEVEAALGTSTLGGLVHNLDLTSIEASVSGEGSKIDGRAEMAWSAFYAVASSDPESKR